jgi:hypothetical protein
MRTSFLVCFRGSHMQYSLAAFCNRAANGTVAGMAKFRCCAAARSFPLTFWQRKSSTRLIVLRTLQTQLRILFRGLEYWVSRSTDELGDLRISYGLVVAARTEDPGAADTGLQTGDVIHTINGNPVSSAEALRSAVSQIRQGDPVALLIERGGKLLYVAFEME